MHNILARRPQRTFLRGDIWLFLASWYYYVMSQLTRRAWKGVAQFLGTLCLLLFLPAWTLRYWQAWWYIGITAICVIVVTTDLIRNDRALLERRLHVGPTAEKEKSQKLIMAFASVSFIAMFLISALDYRFHWSEVSPLDVEIGNLLVVLGFAIIFLVFRVNSHTAGTIGVEDGQQVIDSGPYSYVRHPMYVGGLILLLGTPPALASWWGELAFFPILAAVVWRLLEEERFLGKELTGYSVYMRRVRSRLIPNIF